MTAVICPECEAEVGAEADLCPRCGEDLRLWRDRASLSATKDGDRVPSVGDRRPQGRRFSVALEVGLTGLFFFGGVMLLLGLLGLFALIDNSETNPEWRGDQVGAGIIVASLFLPAGVSSLLCCGVFFASERRRWVWLLSICIPLLPVGLFIYMLGQTDDPIGPVLVAIPLVLSIPPISLSLVGLRGRWRRGT
jgi:ribosomal protein L40E